MSTRPTDTPPSHPPHVRTEGDDADKDFAASAAGLRSIAIFEALKGILVLAVGLGLTAFLHHDAKDFVEHVTHHMRLNPAHHISQVFIAALTHLTDINLSLLAFGSLAYSLVRFVEAYGLWYRRVWAEWFAIFSGGVYLPFELYELFERPRPVKLGLVVVNLTIVVYLVWQRLRQMARDRSRARKLLAAPATNQATNATAVDATPSSATGSTTHN